MHQSNDCTLITLPGNSLDASVFAPLHRLMSPYCKIYNIELPDHGNTSMLIEISIGTLSTWLSDRINSIGGNKVILAHSLSGHFVCQCLLKLQDIKSIILIGTPPLGELSDMQLAFSDIGKLMFIPNWSVEELKLLTHSFSNTDPYAIEKIISSNGKDFRKLMNTPTFYSGFKDEVCNVNKTDIPITICINKDDPFIKSPYIVSLQHRLKNPEIKLCIKETGGHIPFFKHPQVFAQMLLDMLKI